MKTVLMVIGSFLIFFPLLWSSVVMMISAISGWMKLGSVYKSDIPMQGKKIWVGVLSMGFKGFFKSQYNNLVRVSCDRDHLYMGVLLPFRMGHPTLNIPFSDMAVVDAKPTIWGTKRKTLKTERVPDIEILLTEKVVKTIEDHFSALAKG